MKTKVESEYGFDTLAEIFDRINSLNAIRHEADSNKLLPNYGDIAYNSLKSV